MATRPPPPPYSAEWRISGRQNDSTSWEVCWHLSLPGALSFDYASVHELHEDCLIWSEPFFSNVLADATVTSLSRFTATGPATSVGDEAFLARIGTRGRPVPAAIAVPVRQLVQARGRGRSGRFFLPAPAEEDVDFGFQLTPGAKSALSTELTNCFNGVNAISTPAFPSVRFAVIHRREHGAWLAAAQVEPVDTWLPSLLLGTQDRRMKRLHTP